MNESLKGLRRRRITVLAYGEGQTERIFLRHLDTSFTRRAAVVAQTGSAGGGDPESILNKAIAFRRGEPRNVEFILLDTLPEWPTNMVEKADREQIRLIGSCPCVEAFFLNILGQSSACEGKGAGTCKKIFLALCPGGKFTEEACRSIFTKSVLSDARERIPELDFIIRAMEGQE